MLDGELDLADDVEAVAEEVLVVVDVAAETQIQLRRPPPSRRGAGKCGFCPFTNGY